MFNDAVQDILQEVAAATPAPGGGSVAAIAGAGGAALLAMVCRLTIGKKKYEAVGAAMEEALARAESLQNRLAVLVTEDCDAFNEVMAALKQPKDAPEQAAERQASIEAATRRAIEVPWETMRTCIQALELAEWIVPNGNRNALSDGGVAVLMLAAGLEGAYLNVVINLGGIRDAAFVETCRRETTALREQASQIKQRVLEAVNRDLG